MTPAALLSLWLGSVDLDELLDAVRALVAPGDDEADVKALCRAAIDSAVPEELLPVWGAQAQDVIDAAGDRAGAWLYRRIRAPRKVRGGKLPAALRHALEGLRAALQARGETVPEKLAAALAGA